MKNKINLITPRQRLLIKGALLFAYTITNKDGRLFLTRKQNPRLFKLLDKIQIFEFYSTNNGQIVGLSQIVAYLSYGWKAYLNGFTAPCSEIEVHHVNGDVQDNNPENLVYLSRQDHQYISSCTYTPFYGKVLSDASTPFNRQGKTITNKHHFLVNILIDTVSNVSSRRSGHSISLSYPQVLLALPKLLWKRRQNFTIMPHWMTTSIFHALNPISVNLYA